MQTHDRLFSSMRGGEVLCYVRDVVMTAAVKKRSFLEQSAAIGGEPLGESELAEIRALDAAADCIQFAVSAGQEAVSKGKGVPEWVSHMAAQARVTLTAAED